jgi:hypothetical protein
MQLTNGEKELICCALKTNPTLKDAPVPTIENVQSFAAVCVTESLLHYATHVKPQDEKAARALAVKLNEYLQCVSINMLLR